jgi:hypothetical protein
MAFKTRIIKNDDPSCIRIGVQSSLSILLLFSIIDFLKNHPAIRKMVGFIGILAFFVGLFFKNISGLAIPAQDNTFFDSVVHFSGIAFALLVTGGILSVSFFFSSSLFLFVLENDRPAIALEETKKAEEDYEKDNKDPFAYLELDAKKLSEYYQINQRQARSSFGVAIFGMILGFIIVLLGVWFGYKGITENKSAQVWTSSLSSMSGIIMNVVSLLFIRFHNNAQKRSLIYFNQLIRNQQLGLSIRLAMSMGQKTVIDSQKSRIIETLLVMFTNESGKIFIDKITEQDESTQRGRTSKSVKTKGALSKTKGNGLAGQIVSPSG